jgi:hypothetical protein
MCVDRNGPRHALDQTLTIVHVAAKGDGAVDALVSSVARVPPRLELRESTVNRVARSGKRQGAVTSGVPHQPGHKNRHHSQLLQHASK